MNIQPIPTYEGIHYEQLDNDIHFIRALQSTRQAVVSLFSVIESLYFTTPPSGVVALLVDANDASMPINASLRLASELEKKYPNHIPVNIALLQHHPLGPILQTLLRPLHLRNMTRLFESNQRDEAIQWLLSKQEEALLVAHLASSSR